MIKVENLSKWYGRSLAVDDISFSVEKGEVMGFIGPNGAGKSTTMRIATGFIPASKGKVSVGGFDIEDDPISAKSLMGYLPENAPVYSNMTVSAFLEFCCRMRGFRGGDLKRRVDSVVEKCFLSQVLHKPVDTLSKGFRHRTCFAQAIMHDPDVLILDEPTDGLDPNQKREVRGLIRDMGKTKAIILSTHILEEVEAVCTRALVINKGRKVFDGTPVEFKGLSDAAGSVVAEIAGPSPNTLKERLSSISGVSAFEIVRDSDPAVVRLRIGKGASDSAVKEAASAMSAKEGWILRTLKSEEGRLDEVFHKITENDRTMQGSSAR